MFGANYHNHPEMLVESLREMNSKYKKNSITLSPLMRVFTGIYLKIFGIPEIGFQVRGMYFRQALAFIKDFSPKTILDVGSGIGCYTFFMAKRYPAAFVTGWEIDKRKLKFTKILQKELAVSNTSFAYGDIVEKTTGRNQYDFIVTIDVLEHITEYKKVLKNMYRLLKPQGYLYIHVPQIKQKRFFHELSMWEHDDHVREGFEPKVFAKELRSLGLTVKRVRHTYGFFGSLAWELNHLLLSKNQMLAALLFPILYLLVLLDGLTNNTKGLCVSLLLKKS